MLLSRASIPPQPGCHWLLSGLELSLLPLPPPPRAGCHAPRRGSRGRTSGRRPPHAYGWLAIHLSCRTMPPHTLLPRHPGGLFLCQRAPWPNLRSVTSPRHLLEWCRVNASAHCSLKTLTLKKNKSSNNSLFSPVFTASWPLTSQWLCLHFCQCWKRYYYYCRFIYFLIEDSLTSSRTHDLHDQGPDALLDFLKVCKEKGGANTWNYECPLFMIPTSQADWRPSGVWICSNGLFTQIRNSLKPHKDLCGSALGLRSQCFHWIYQNRISTFLNNAPYGGYSWICCLLGFELTPIKDLCSIHWCHSYNTSPTLATCSAVRCRRPRDITTTTLGSGFVTTNK